MRSVARLQWPARTDAGFTLVETLVALVIGLLALLFATQLLLESQRLFVEDARAAQDPLDGLIARQLRADIQGAATTSGGDEMWRETALQLVAPGGLVVYARTPAGLERTLFDPTTGERLGSRVVLPELAAFRWRLLPGGLVDVDLGWATGADAPRWTSGRAAPPTPRLQTLALRAGMRGAGAYGW